MLAGQLFHLRRVWFLEVWAQFWVDCQFWKILLKCFVKFSAAKGSYLTLSVSFFKILVWKVQKTRLLKTQLLNFYKECMIGTNFGVFLIDKNFRSEFGHWAQFFNFKGSWHFRGSWTLMNFRGLHFRGLPNTPLQSKVSSAKSVLISMMGKVDQEM